MKYRGFLQTGGIHARSYGRGSHLVQCGVSCVHCALTTQGCLAQTVKMRENSPQTKNAKTFLPDYERDAALL